MSNYTDQQRAEAIALYSEVGPSEVERQLGIPKGTVTKWGQAAGVETRFLENAQANVQASTLKWEQRRADLVHRLGAVADAALARVESNLFEVEHVKVGQAGSEPITEARYTGKSAREYATTMAILIDKAQLLSGAATSRSEVTTHDTDVDTKLAELIEAAKHDDLDSRRNSISEI